MPKFIIIFLLLVYSLPSVAEAPHITGDTDITVSAGSITNVASGHGSVAETILGSITSGIIAGNFKTNVVVSGDVVNTATDGGYSQIMIGSVGSLIVN